MICTPQKTNLGISNKKYDNRYTKIVLPQKNSDCYYGLSVEKPGHLNIAAW
jgi:hypothetical protein